MKNKANMYILNTAEPFSFHWFWTILGHPDGSMGHHYFIVLFYILRKVIGDTKSEIHRYADDTVIYCAPPSFAPDIFNTLSVFSWALRIIKSPFHWVLPSVVTHLSKLNFHCCNMHLIYLPAKGQTQLQTIDEYARITGKWMKTEVLSHTGCCDRSAALLWMVVYYAAKVLCCEATVAVCLL